MGNRGISQVIVRIEELRWVEMAEDIVKYLSLGFKCLWVLWYPSNTKKKKAADQNVDKTVQLEAEAACLDSSIAGTTGRKIPTPQNPQIKDY